MLRYMLDTDICIYVLKRRPPELREQFDRLAEELSISSVTLAELYYGAEKSSRQVANRHAVEEFAATGGLAVLGGRRRALWPGSRGAGAGGPALRPL